jgi:ribosomal protein L37AE/L43A
VPCFRCGARQTDPTKGPSNWQRAVRADEQVLVCPDCQRTGEWTAEVDHCPGCGSHALRRALGTTSCRACGWSADQSAAATRSAVAGHDSSLAEEVAAAVDRMLHRDGG